MKTPDYKHAAELLEDPSFLLFCLDTDSEEKKQWEDRIREDPKLQAVALLAKQTFWSLRLRHPDHLGNEVHQFNVLRQQKGYGKATFKQKAKKNWLRIAAAAVLVVGMTIAVVINLTPVASIETTQVGEIKKITLPDGSVMYLNGNSRVSFTKKGFLENRLVTVNQGEAFFDVAPNTASIFTVQTPKGLKVEDISTAFTVRSLADMDQETVQVQEGLVRFIDPSGKNTQLLEEGQSIRFDHKTGQVSRFQSDALSASGWINGQYALFDVTLCEFSKILSSVFDIEVRFSNTINPAKRISILFNKNQKVDDILHNLETVYGLEIIIDGKIVQI